ncbi:hypothetical protein MTP99_019390 [Tenebrio molitor]|jgi:hypothetical protein|nr:hypothetical protein MTP99_019390 [Tenebrio molitor]
MLKYCAVIVLALCYVQFALGLKCYVTDGQNISERDYSGLTPHPEDCEVYIKDMMEAQGHGGRRIRPNIVFRCFTVTINTDFAKMWVKGCIPAGKCPALQEDVKLRLEATLKAPINSVTCNECTNDKCNA